MRRYLFLAAAGLSLLAGGCKSMDAVRQGIIGESTYTTFSGRFIQVADQRRVGDADAGGSTAIAEALSGKGGTDTRRLDGRDPLPPGAQELQGAKPLKDYADTILAKLLRHWPYAAPPVKLVVTTSPAYVAEAVPAGTILLSQGVFVNGASEDELAFILAHELAHILLNHMDADRHYAARKVMEDTAAGTLLTIASRNNPQGSRNAMLAYAGYRAVQETVLNPAWTRVQEDEADLLGLDLLERAGYNSAIYQVVMQRLASDIEKQEAKAEAERSRFDQEVAALMESGQIDAGLDAAFGKLAEAPSVILGRIIDQVSGKHNSPNERSGDLDAYIMREEAYDALSRPLTVQPYERAVFQGAALRALARSVLAQRADGLIEEGKLAEAEAFLKDAAKGGFETDPQLRLSFYRLHVKQGRPDLALKDLEIAVQSPAAPREAFDFLILEYRNAGRTAQALAALDRMEARFGGTGQNYPLRMKLLLEAGRHQDAAMVYERCRSLRGDPVVRECGNVWDAAMKGPAGGTASGKVPS
jgi:predicted Zn-dependent protease